MLRGRFWMLEIGQTVRVVRVRDRISSEAVGKLKANPVGVVQAYRMVDGSGVGVVVKFDEGFSTWFFEDELKVEA